MSKDGTENVKKLPENRDDVMLSMIEIAKALTSCLEIRSVLETIMKQVERLISPAAWSLLLVDKESGDLVFEIAVSPVAEQLQGLRLRRGEGIAGWVALNGGPLLIPDVSSDERFQGQFDQRFSFTTQSIVCVPMKIKERVVGVIELINSLDKLVFNQADMTILSAIADFAAIAIENARNYDRINELVITDDLTGLYNSRHFPCLIQEEVDRCVRYGMEMSLVFLDLDRLKGINDVHGHLVGSRMLSELGHLIARNIRANDRAARYGGDEFVIILPHTGKEAAMAMAANLRQRLHETDFSSDDGQPIRLTASFGVASFPEDAASREELIRAADIAMYEAKHAGRDTIKGYAAAGNP
ncbi:MAG TPA: sensor domain-containing diguanylate cyclase [Geobacter sp.]|nr:sensor domain-containing diguanylate cyclase [Geobacter sp.]